jgi:hypothetical protein
MDGGSDSLMVGNEAGLGDPLEDAASVAAAAAMKGNIRHRMVISVGFGADRYNDVSDFSSLRAVAEITKAGGFLGSVSLEPSSLGYEFYKGCVLKVEI